MAAKTWGTADKLNWQRARIAQHVAKGQLEATPNIKNFIAGKPMTDTAKPTIGFKTNPKKPNAGATIVANQPSTCFDNLEWTDGIATASFANKTVGDWDYEMTREEFLEWAQSDSLGEYFNDNIG
jgi:hypothetical protein